MLRIGTLASWLLPLELLPWHPSLVPVVPHKSLDRVEPSIRRPPPPSTPVSGALIPEYKSPLVSTALLITTRHRRVYLRSSPRPVPARRLYLPTLTPMLTTTAFDRSGLEWFEACSWKPASKGLPSSLVQLLRAQVSFHSKPPNSCATAHAKKISKLLVRLIRGKSCQRPQQMGQDFPRGRCYRKVRPAPWPLSAPGAGGA